MFDEFETFLETPSATHYRAARAALLAGGELTVSPGELSQLAELYDRQNYEAALAHLDEMMPRWALSPRAHYHASMAAAALGDFEDAELERFMMDACLRGILATGRGSSSSPYLVTYSADAGDVLMARGLVAESQALTARKDRFCDVITCADNGGELWFDVTEALMHIDEASRRKELARH